MCWHGGTWQWNCFFLVFSFVSSPFSRWTSCRLEINLERVLNSVWPDLNDQDFPSVHSTVCFYHENYYTVYLGIFCCTMNTWHLLHIFQVPNPGMRQVNSDVPVVRLNWNGTSPGLMWYQHVFHHIHHYIHISCRFWKKWNWGVFTCYSTGQMCGHINCKCLFIRF